MEILDRIISSTARARRERMVIAIEERDRMDRFEKSLKQKIAYLQAVTEKTQSAQKESLLLQVRYDFNYV